MTLNVPKIQQIMLEKQITQADLARKIRISRQAVNEQLMKGTCSINRAHRYAEILGVPATEIVIEHGVQKEYDSDKLDRIIGLLERIAER